MSTVPHLPYTEKLVTVQSKGNGIMACRHTLILVILYYKTNKYLENYKLHKQDRRWERKRWTRKSLDL